MHYDKGKSQTRILEQNVHNLVYGMFDGEGEFDIPKMHPVHIDNLADLPLQGFNYALSEKYPGRIGVHFFLHDYQFERVWRCPDRYTYCLSKFAFVLSPDFSPYAGIPKALKVFNIYRKMWCGRYWQEYGMKVIPTITWGDDEDLDWCLDGVPKHSTIAISTMGEGRWSNFSALKYNWQRVMDTLEPETILLYGKDLSNELPGNIIYKRLINSKVAI